MGVGSYEKYSSETPDRSSAHLTQAVQIKTDGTCAVLRMNARDRARALAAFCVAVCSAADCQA
jgi:hypothetical protein